VSVFAYHAGGAKAVGIVWVLRMGPAALVSPFSSVLADRLRREYVMIGADLLRAGLIGVAAAVVWLHGSPWIVYVLAAVPSFVSRSRTPHEPARGQPIAPASILADVGAGFTAIGADSRLRLLVGLLGAQTLVAGAFEVLVVVTAIRLLDLGNSGVGFLNSA